MLPVLAVLLWMIKKAVKKIKKNILQGMSLNTVGHKTVRQTKCYRIWLCKAGVLLFYKTLKNY